MVMGIPIQRQDGPQREIVSAPTPSLMTRHNGVMKTAMVLAAMRAVKMPMIVPQQPVLPMLTGMDVLTVTAMVIQMQETHSQTTPLSGQTVTVTTVAII